jgi:nitrate/nitrite transporter NarK
MASTLFVASIAGAIGIPALADRLGAVKTVMIASAVTTSAAVVLLSAANPALFWVLIPLAGGTTQGVGALAIAHAVQMKEIGFAYAGTALGLIGSFANLGGFIMPLVGGKLAEADQSLPFVVWSLSSLSAAICFALLKNVKRPA